jgi:transposase
MARLICTPADGEQRAGRLARDLHRYQTLQSDIAELDEQITQLLATTDGQVLTSLPGVAVIRAAAFAAHCLPVTRFPDAEHLYSATGLGTGPLRIGDPSPPRPDLSARLGRAPRRVMGIAWGLSISSPSFAQRKAELCGRGMAPIRARVALARLRTQQPFDEQRYRQGRLSRGR